MKIVRRIQEMRKLSLEWRQQGKSAGFVPTMGALHDGHLSLIRRARSENNRVVVSIFVNPIQFGPKEDFKRYPRPWAKDVKLCREAGVDAVFVPSGPEMYPEGFQTKISVSALSQWLCGPFRPGHFDGVATVVAKLFNAVGPHKAYFGQKDYQQLQVVRAMVRDLNLPVEIVGCPTVRERDGLAMSSRNAYLSAPERRQASHLHGILRLAAKMIEDGEKSAFVLKKTMSKQLSRIDYVEVCDPETLAPLRRIGRRPVLLALAVRIGKTRLIDNLIIT